MVLRLYATRENCQPEEAGDTSHHYKILVITFSLKFQLCFLNVVDWIIKCTFCRHAYGGFVLYIQLSKRTTLNWRKQSCWCYLILESKKTNTWSDISQCIHIIGILSGKKGLVEVGWLGGCLEIESENGSWPQRDKEYTESITLCRLIHRVQDTFYHSIVHARTIWRF